MGKTPDLSGKRIGMLTVLCVYGKNKYGQVVWECVCDCGKITHPTSGDLLSGHTTSCGCVRGKKLGNFARTHGESRTRLYKEWQDMRYRCYNPNNSYYENYGMRGIIVCQEWKDSYESFRNWAINNGYSENLTLDRIDVNGNYEPSNCRWSNQYEQANNRTNNNIVSYHGKIDTLTNMCRSLNVNYSVIKSRIRLGYSFEEAIDNFKHTSSFIEYWKNKR